MPVRVDELQTNWTPDYDDHGPLGGNSNPLTDCGVTFDLSVDDGTGDGCHFKLATFAYDWRKNSGRWELDNPIFLNILAWNWFGHFERVGNVLHFYSEGTSKVGGNRADFLVRDGAAYGSESGHPDTGSGAVNNPRNTPWCGTAIRWTRTDPSYARK